MFNTGRVDQENWEKNGDWFLYPFEYGRIPERVGELNIFENVQVILNNVQKKSVLYRLRDRPEPASEESAMKFQGTILIFCAIGTNAGHLLSEIISFSNFYLDKKLDYRVAISDLFVTNANFMLQLMQKLLPGVRFIVLNNDCLYTFEKLILRRNRWFNFLRDWQNTDYERKKDFLTFSHLDNISGRFADDIAPLQALVSETYEDNQHRFDKNEKIILFKTTEDAFATTPERALFVSPEARELAKNRGYSFINVGKFSDINEYISTLYHANRIIISYGAIACANRFFVNSRAELVLIGHRHYKSEYDLGPDLWHLRHSHLFPVARQYVFLDCEDTVSVNDMDKFLAVFDGQNDSAGPHF